MNIKPHHLMIALISFFYIYPLTRANVLYADDLWRTLSGYTGFLENGRFGAEALVIAISSSMDIADASPMSQVLAAVVFMISGYVFYKKVNPESSKFERVIVSLSFLITPSTLEQLSFRFDSITMSLSVLFCVLSFISYKRSTAGLIAFSSLFLLSMSFYQTSLGLMIGLIAASNIIKSDSYIKDDCIKILITLICYVFYSKVLFAFCGVSEHAVKNGEIINLNSDGLAIVAENIRRINMMTFSLFRSKDGYAYYLISAMSILSIFIGFRKSARKTSFAVKSTLAFIIICALAIFPIAMLKNPMIQPRVMFIYPVFMMLALHSCMSIKYKNLGMIIGGVICLHGFVFMSVYANTLKYQYDNNLRFSNSLERVLEDVGYRKDIPVAFDGMLNQPPYVERSKHSYKIISYLMQDYFNGNYVLGFAFLRTNNILIKNTEFIPEQHHDESMKKISESRYGNLYRTDTGYLFKYNK